MSIIFQWSFYVNKRLISIDVETKQVANLNNGLGELETCNVLRIENDWVSASWQGYNRRPSLVNCWVFLLYSYDEVLSTNYF